MSKQYGYNIMLKYTGRTVQHKAVQVGRQYLLYIKWL